MKERNKELKREYQQTPRPMGIWQIRNLANEKVLVGAALNLPGILNRHQFELRAGSHQNRALQADWNRYGEASFVFEVLDELTPSDAPARNYREELAFLEDLWLDRLQPCGERGYNEPRKTREERLRMIGVNRT
ncbi:MAG: GIY-YIG nuclease family protein [Blastocatellia bacterium]|nr:GIY-YIG nuclease family protein [Blastocatellia bacterium]